jgi:signal transduction histidine kinase/CheY-like chemotaxis protein
MIGKGDYDLFRQEEADFFTRKDREVLAGGRVLDISEESIMTRAKGLRYLRTVKVPIADPAGNSQYLLGISEDVTDRKRMEEGLRKAQKTEAIGTLAGGIAHDFNNILGSIIGFAELARMDCAGNARAAENLENVLEAGHRAKALVEQIMAYGRQREPDLQPLDPSAAVASSVKLLRAALPASISIETDLATPAPTILADPTQLHQLVMNLATNGAHAMADEGGVLVVALERVEVAGDQTATDLEPGSYVRLTVRDIGVGMDPPTLERIFEPFFTTKPPGQGTGLGLSVVHGIVRSHRGTIRVRSRPGHGTTFEVYFPVHDGAARARGVEESAVPRGHGERVLFVDDEAPLVAVGRGVLERLGYHVTATTSPVEAVAVFRSHPDAFDLVVTDLTMPALSGADLAQELQRIRPGIPILVSTGYDGRLTPEAARSIGICGLLTKPNTIETLARAVHGALARPA